MTKKERKAFDEAMAAFDEGVERLDKTLDLALGLASSDAAEEDEENDEEVVLVLH